MKKDPKWSFKSHVIEADKSTKLKVDLLNNEQRKLRDNDIAWSFPRTDDTIEQIRKYD